MAEHRMNPNRARLDDRRAVPFRPSTDPNDLPVEKMLEHFSKGNGSASALAQRRVLNDLGVASQSGAPSAAAGVRAAGPLSGRRSVSTKPAAPRVGGKPGGGGGKVSDGDLLTSMVQRLNGLERKMAEQRNLLVEKDAEIAELSARQEEKDDDSRLVAELTDENIKLKRRQLEMEKFLADYGLAWVGDNGSGSGGTGKETTKPVETELVPLVAPGQVAAAVASEQPAAEQGQRLGDGSGGGGGIGQRLGDGSYIPAPHPNRLGGGGGTPPGDESTELTHGGAVQLGQPGAALLGAKEQAEEAKKAAEGTIAEFDMPKILRHIQDLNYLAGDGSAQTAQRADGAHVLVELDPLPLTLFKNGLLIREGPFRPFTKPDAKAFMKDLQDGYFPYELKYAFPEGVPFSVDDRREEEYTTEKGGAGSCGNVHTWSSHQSNQRHGGGGQGGAAALLKRLPETVIKNGQVVNVRGEIGEMMGVQPESNAAGGGGGGGPVVRVLETDASRDSEAAAVEGDPLAARPSPRKSERLTSLQVKSSDGREIYHLKMWSNESIGAVVDVLRSQVSSLGSWKAEFALRTAFPNKVYEDMSESLASAGLVPNAVMMIRPNNPDQQQPSGEADAVTTSTASTAMDGPGPPGGGGGFDIASSWAH